MGRFATPALLLGAAAYALVRLSVADRALVFPALAAVTRDPWLQGALTVTLLTVLGGLSLAWSSVGLVRSALRPPAAPPGPPAAR